MSTPATTRDDRALAATAASCAALVFVVVAASAWLRLAPPVPCPPSGCEGFALADAVRIAHRVAAMGVSVLALVIAALAWKAPVAWGRRAAAAAIIALVVVLSIVGRQSADAASIAIVLTNLLGGFALLALAAGLAASAGGPSETVARAATRLSAVILSALALLAVTAPAWPLAPWLNNLLASTALVTTIVAAVAARRGPGKGASAPARPLPAEP